MHSTFRNEITGHQSRHAKVTRYANTGHAELGVVYDGPRAEAMVRLSPDALVELAVAALSAALEIRADIAEWKAQEVTAVPTPTRRGARGGAAARRTNKTEELA